MLKGGITHWATRMITKQFPYVKKNLRYLIILETLALTLRFFFFQKQNYISLISNFQNFTNVNKRNVFSRKTDQHLDSLYRAYDTLYILKSL